MAVRPGSRWQRPKISEKPMFSPVILRLARRLLQSILFALVVILMSGMASAQSSPSGLIAFMTDRDGNYEIYVMNADGSNLRNLTRNKGWDQYPVWSPDGAQIAF